MSSKHTEDHIDQVTALAHENSLHIASIVEALKHVKDSILGLQKIQKEQGESIGDLQKDAILNTTARKALFALILATVTGLITAAIKFLF